MSALRSFLQRAPHERWLLLRACILLGATAVSVRLLPFRATCRLFNRNLRRRPPTRSEREIASAIAVAALHVPGSNCLSEAFACLWLLRSHGHTATIRLGVRKDSSFAAHAWLQLPGGEIVLGGAASPCEYMPLSGGEIG